ncbi:uncharacterized protein [Periplaneta americana]
MKYPQLVSMPSAVQDWLDEQLEARGIDAVVYTRYVLSLLQRDTLDSPDDLLVLSPNKGKEVGRRGRKRGRNREECWDVWDCEQLKRSAAVECLMSASDQKCGIEKLVDELCIKLKEIQSEGESSIHLELSQASVPAKQANTASPQDQVQKYYAAFPPLNSKVADSITSPEPASAWSGKKVLGKSKPGTTDKDKDKASGWADENKENRGKNNSSWKEVGRESTRSRSQVREKARAKKEACYGFAWNMADLQNKVDSTVCRRLYERQRSKMGGDADDRNLAQLIAKFDHSIEALWSPEEPAPVHNGFLSDDSLDCDQELQLDFKQLLSSPGEQLYNKRNPIAFPATNSFIQCGTNITSSIWSDQNSIEQEEFGMEYVHCDGSKPCEDESRPVCNKYDSLPSIFTSLPWMVNSSKQQQQQQSSYSPFGLSDSLNTLNHNREDSSFTEVVPKQSGPSGLLQQSRVACPEPKESGSPKEEEDLLTSTRTHFRPIRVESLESHGSTASNNVGCYADGTTFVISTSLDEVAFRRSESGALYLEAGLETPDKYMEYKEKEAGGGREFVPKFKVRQNEKCCQTDVVDDEEVDSKRSRHDLQDDFYFPDDQHFAEKIISAEVAGSGQEDSCSHSLQTWKAGWPDPEPNNIWQSVGSDKSNSWYSIWKWSPGPAPMSHDTQYSRLREELTMEGEQLLSDLSYMQHLYQADDDTDELLLYAEDSGRTADVEWKQNERPFNAKAVQKDRKRRHSASQRACSYFLEGSCRRPHCRFSHDLAAIPCRFWADSSCLKGIACPFLHGSAQTLRPVTL